MALSINLNTAALTAQRELSKTSDALNKSIERLSSGLRINTAADDPAGLVISEKLKAQVNGLGQAITNAGNAVNMVQTAEGALGEVSNLLLQMRNLAVNAANAGANDTATVAADQAQIANALASINKIASETQFGQKNLLDGSAGIKANVVGSGVLTANLSNLTMSTPTASVYMCVTQAATHGQWQSNANYWGQDTWHCQSTGYILVNNVRIDYSTADDLDSLTAAINNVSDQTGVSATDSAGVITMNSRGYGAVGGRINVVDSQNVLLSGSSSVSVGGANAQAQVWSGGTTNNLTDSKWQSGDGLTLKDSLGNEIVLMESTGTTTGPVGTTPGVASDQIDAVNGTLVFQVGAYAGQVREVNIGAVTTNNLGAGVVTGKTLSSVNVMSPGGAQDALNILDQAISDISSTRANLGAMQTDVLQTTINSLTVTKQNLAASASAITDTDMASEVTQMTRNQILEQAGVSMLAQANQVPQTLLKLLQ